ncbi:hypothetical protein SARC_05852 [Sphaeroforma arctica JP610]|uniref:Ubiquitin-like modifier-activating enzyme ATG7 n=1 Tax=Sphaeroforma arctica JP610 TaxID=667725 RepID=A0A0L0FYC9_9EUKA|nr:hypothetical protein SARC_05852 [Sphaeroforma arctica JP610]KNC81847.1 hypothetical protein SARC_05852 [Sphaeroforma arctica JP610]|eukprot:XP_014155749.1 hypothetical protein SARC_05852 [Sphaeroforma arctica JP610]
MCTQTSQFALLLSHTPLVPTVPVQGVLKLMNQLDHFQSVDKQQLLETEGYKVWRDIVSGRALEHPELLNRSLLLAYIDLKKFLYYFWFAFPALSLKYEMDRPGIPLSAHRSQTYVDHMLATHVRQGRPAFFCIVDTDGLDPDADGEVVELKAWEAAVDKPNRRLTVGFLDPSTHPQHPGWPLRNLLALVRFHTHARVDVIDVVCLRKNFRNGQASTERSIAFKLGHQVAVQMAMPKIVGWERNVKGKLGPRVVNLGASMDPRTLAESAIDLNLSLMKWRILPGLDLDVIKDTKCLLLGAGTLGCNVARCLMGWGVRHITFVDNGYVSYSNPARQSLFSFKDCIGGGTEKAIAAAANLAEIFPGMVTEGHHMSIPMPGHSVAQSEEAEIRQTVDKLSDLIAAHDVVYLLMDTRESRWLPTLLCQSMNKLALNAALGFDQYMVMRHGTQKSQDDVRLGCYFCNDVVAPANSTKDRTLDQQCTVTRPGLSFMASALATELMVSVLQHPLK